MIYGQRKMQREVFQQCVTGLGARYIAMFFCQERRDQHRADLAIPWPVRSDIQARRTTAIITFMSYGSS